MQIINKIRIIDFAQGHRVFPKSCFWENHKNAFKPAWLTRFSLPKNFPKNEEKSPNLCFWEKIHFLGTFLGKPLTKSGVFIFNKNAYICITKEEYNA